MISLAILCSATRVCAGLREIWTTEQVWSFSAEDTEIDPAGDVLQLWGETQANAAVIVKISGADGSILWERSIDYAGFEMHLDLEGNAIFSGRTPLFGTTNDMVTAKFDRETGAILWERRSTNAHGIPLLNWSGVDEAGNVFAVGSFLVGTNSIYRLVEYSGTDGATRWEIEPNLQVAIVKVGKNGSLLLAGVQSNRLTVIKLNGDDGSVLWRSQPSTNSSRIYEAQMDQDGNIVVSGHKGYTAKIRGENGELMWEHVNTSFNNGRQVDFMANGDVIAFYDSAACNETYLTKYAVDNGAVLWQRTFPTPLRCVMPGKIAINSSGNVIFVREVPKPDFVTQFIASTLDGRTGETIAESVVPNVGIGAVTYARGLLAVAGADTGHWSPARVRFYRFGPELKTRLMGNELEIEWDPDSGTRLEKSISLIGGGQEWLTVQGSSETNLLRVVTGDRPEFFRLVAPPPKD